MTKPPETLDSEASAPQHANIYQALNAVMAEVGYVKKQSGPGLNYTYAGEAALIQAIRPSMVKHGVIVMPVAVTDLRTETYTTSKGSVMNRTVGIFSFDFIHAESGTIHRVTVLGEGADSGDKSANKASTGALKYALRQTLIIETGDDPDRQPSGEQERQPAATLEKRHWSENKLTSTRFAQYMETNGLTADDLIAVFGVENLFELPDDSHEVKAALEAHLAIKYASET